MTTQSPEQPPDRWQEIVDIGKHHQFLYGMAGFLIGVLFFPLLHLIVTDIDGLFEGLVPESVGIMFTVFFIDRLYRDREAKRERRELKARLIRELGSPDNATALNAARELADHRWLYDGSLQGVHLMKANLKGADLMNADLQSARLDRAKLQGAELWRANLRGANLDRVVLHSAKMSHIDLQGACLSNANLKDASLPSANLQGANLLQANLRGADLAEAYLQGANLSGAKLQGADLFEARLKDTRLICEISGQVQEAIFDGRTRLPDGSYWTPETDMRKFGCIVDSSDAE